MPEPQTNLALVGGSQAQVLFQSQGRKIGGGCERLSNSCYSDVLWQ